MADLDDSDPYNPCNDCEFCEPYCWLSDEYYKENEAPCEGKGDCEQCPHSDCILWRGPQK